MSILVVGSVAFDSVKTPFGERERILGGSATYFSVAASFFTDVRVVAVVGEDFGPEEDAVFLDRNVDISDLERVPGRSFFWSGEYGFDLNVAKTRDTQLNVFADFKPKLSDKARETPYLFLGNIQPQLQVEVREQVAAKLVAADTMNYWIDTKRDELLKTLARVRILLINEEEARQLTGEAVTHKAARAILSMGPETVVVKMGEHGAFLQGKEVYFACPAFPVESVVDPTGAGDTFAGGFMGALARMGRVTDMNLRRAAIYGCVLASFAVEEFSVGGLLNLERTEILRRADAILAMSHVTLDNTARLLR